MVPIGVGLAMGAYWVGIWGYCLVRGYDVTFMECMKGTWPATGGGGAGTGGKAGGKAGPRGQDPAIKGVQGRVGAGAGEKQRAGNGMPAGGVSGRL